MILRSLKKIVILLLSISLFSCNTNKLKIDVSDIEVNIKIKRFHDELYNADINNIENTIEVLQNKYSKFYKLFNHKIIEIGGANSKNYPHYFIIFLSDYTVNELMNEVNKEFVAMENIEQKLNNSFKHYKYYFPEKEIPEIITFVSGFNQSIVIDENLLAIGLDKYLGAENHLYNYLGVPNYKTKNMHQEKIVSDCMRAIALTEFEYNDSVDNLVANMIYQGQIMYFVNAMLPYETYDLIIGFSEDELTWCKSNEKQIWTFFVEEKLLFSSEYMQIKKYVDDAPFTSTFSHDSPGRTGVWIGWQIVRSYMKSNSNINLRELMHETNYQEILNKSRYKP